MNHWSSVYSFRSIWKLNWTNQWNVKIFSLFKIEEEMKSTMASSQPKVMVWKKSVYTTGCIKAWFRSSKAQTRTRGKSFSKLELVLSVVDTPFGYYSISGVGSWRSWMKRVRSVRDQVSKIEVRAIANDAPFWAWSQPNSLSHSRYCVFFKEFGWNSLI